LTPDSTPLEGGALQAALNQLVALRYPEPHQLLGMHGVGSGLVVRTWRPEAEAVTVHADDGRQFAMAPLGRGLFSLELPGTRAFPYTLEVRYPGRSFTLRDPYAFWPTLGELDLHLLGEGRHQRPWERLGAHPLQHLQLFFLADVVQDVEHDHGIAAPEFRVPNIALQYFAFGAECNPRALDLAIIAAALVGGCVGFLWYNVIGCVCVALSAFLLEGVRSLRQGRASAP